MTFKRRWTGHVPDPGGHCRTPFRLLRARLGAAAPLIDEYGLAAFAPPIFDQGPTSSCTGHAGARGGAIALAAAGTPLPWVPSPAGGYRNARAIDRPSPEVPLEDIGAMPNMLFRGYEEFGFSEMGPRPADGRFSDADPATINREPQLGELEQGQAHVYVGDYGIFSFGSMRSEEISTSIYAGVPVTAAIAGGSAPFQAYTAGTLQALNAPLDHYILLSKFRRRAGGLEIGGDNSWSEEWGELGSFWLSASALDELGDLVATRFRRKEQT